MVLSALMAQAQQELQYTQNQFNSNLEINPAYAGANDNASISLRYRNQWSGFEGSPNTLSFNAESKVINKVLALGVTVISDKLGITNSTSVDLSLASHIRVTDRATLSVGIKAGYCMLNADFSKLENIDPTDPLYLTDKLSIPYLGLGTLYFTNKFYIGFSIPRMLSFENAAPQTRIIKAHYFLYGGYRLTVDEHIELRPALLVKYVSAAPVEADIAMDVWYQRKFGLGVSYRTGDAFTFAAKGRIGMLAFGYSYDMTTSSLHRFNSGSHEIFLGYQFGKKGTPDRNQNNRYF